VNEIFHVEFVGHNAEQGAMIVLFLFQHGTQRGDKGQIITMDMSLLEMPHADAVQDRGARHAQILPQMNHVMTRLQIGQDGYDQLRHIKAP
jgi:hypothetical protein